MNQRFQLLLILCGMILHLSACSEDDDGAINPQLTEYSFLRIYDQQDINYDHYPIDVVNTPDSGFLMVVGRRVEGSDFLGIDLIKADASGGFVRKTSLPDRLVNPVRGFIQNNEQAPAFVCMTNPGLAGRMLRLDQVGNLAEERPLGLRTPLAVDQLNENQVLALGYNAETQQSIVQEWDADGTTLRTSSFNIGAGQDTDRPIVEHLIRTGRKLPFLVGSAGNNQYYFNGLYNFTLSMVWFTFGNNQPIKVIQGQQAQGGIDAVSVINNEQMAVATFNFGDKYFSPQASIPSEIISSAIDLEAAPMPEVDNDGIVQLLTKQLKERELLIYAADTRNKEILLLAYDANSGQLLGTQYLRLNFPLELASIRNTFDDGLAVLTQTYTLGRFPRAALFKLSDSDLIQWLRL
ncbi:MAG: hypothetical protein LAT68_06655 [Cyclobacteriaceae bacterium]|nr:hypothetical protein [Cyclobacteriaceae bacterium]MCH8515992.1 hypothetical protein [Cyclobacteriaceae bacterium]